MTVTQGHIAILLNDTTTIKHTSKYGNFAENAADMLKKNGCNYAIKIYQVAFEKDTDYTDGLTKVYQELEDDWKSGLVKGVLLTGSATDLFADIQWVKRLDEFIQTYIFRSPKIPAVGICFGHQIIAKNLKCKVDRNSSDVGYEAGTTKIDLNSEIYEIENSPFKNILVDFETGKDSSSFNISEFHFDIVYDLPPKEVSEELNTVFINVGTSSKCEIQGIVTSKGDFKLLTFQGHPEFTPEISLGILQMDIDKKLILQEFYEESVHATKTVHNDGVLIGKSILQFFKNNIE